MEFLFCFLPIVLIVYFLLPQLYRNVWLLFASLFFYAWGEPTFILFMIFSIIFNYLMALRLSEIPAETRGGVARRKLILIISVIVNLAILFVYKYANFTTNLLRSAFPSLQNQIAQTSFVLPIGISFFTFQAMSYVIDVYRGTQAQKNPINIGLYISLFPQLIAGPIVRYTTVEEQIQNRTITFDSFSAGVRRFLIGFNKKMLLANVLGEAADAIFALSGQSVLTSWVGIICYTLQIYYDFSGYSDMAIGLGRFFGFDFLENFDYPYCSGSVTEFWRRWHISLGTWFRDYVYFPLGGSRVKSRLRLVMNLAIVWMLTGIWHGANWTFILWGALYGVLIIVEKLFSIPQKVKKAKVLNIVWHVFTLLMVILGWVLFRSESITKAWDYIRTMFFGNQSAVADATGVFYLREYMIPLIVGVICSTPVFRLLGNRIRSMKNAHMAEALFTIGDVFQIVLFIVCVSALVMQSHNPFIYFNF